MICWCHVNQSGQNTWKKTRPPKQKEIKTKENYFTSSDPHHDMLGGGCQGRVVIENMLGRLPRPSDKSFLLLAERLSSLTRYSSGEHLSNIYEKNKVKSLRQQRRMLKHAKTCQDTTCQTYTRKWKSNMSVDLLKHTFYVLHTLHTRHHTTYVLHYFEFSPLLSDISFDIFSRILPDTSFDIFLTYHLTFFFDILSPTFFVNFLQTYLLTFFLTYLLTFSLTHLLDDMLSDTSSDIVCHTLLEVRHATLNSQNRRWGPARHTELTGSQLRSDTPHWTHRIAVEVRHATLNSRARGWGPARHTELAWSPLGSGTPHWTRRIAVEVRHATLNSRDHSWGPARHTELAGSRLGSGTPHWTHELAVGARHATLNSQDRSWDPTRRRTTGGGGGGRRSTGEGEETNIKSNNPHLTGGEKNTNSPQLTFFHANSLNFLWWIGLVLPAFPKGNPAQWNAKTRRSSIAATAARRSTSWECGLLKENWPNFSHKVHTGEFHPPKTNFQNLKWRITKTHLFGFVP